MSNATTSDLEALRQLASDPRVTELSERHGRFNIFEALALVRHEVRHSQLLAFLLDVDGTHQLGTAFLQRFLRRVGGRLADSERTVLEKADLTLTRVITEWPDLEGGRLDILIDGSESGFVCAIENKVDATEHDNQLERYRRAVEARFPDAMHVLVYLTPSGEEPSDPAYISLGYGDVRRAAEQTLSSRAANRAPDLAVLLRHYVDMIGTHIVGDAEIAKLCRQIYREHRRALELIWQHRPAIADELASLLSALRDELAVSHGATYTPSSSTQWHPFRTPGLVAAQKELGLDDAHLFFDLTRWSDVVDVTLYLSHVDPGRAAELHRHALANPDVFPGAKPKPGKSTTVLFRTWLLTSEDFVRPDVEAMSEKVRAGWREFVENDLPAIEESLAEAGWLGADDDGS